MARDYRPKGVKFVFIYKSLAHPELAGDYVQPFTLEERLAHARQAEQQLGASIPWIVDAMDNRLKHALGDRPNSEFVVDPDGVIISKRAWSHPEQVRRELEEHVGPVDTLTRPDEVRLKILPPLKSAAPRGLVPRLQRPDMQPIVIRPDIDPEGLPFFAKLRAEADAELIRTGAGSLYLGFHIDPFHHAHWNNLTEPLSFELEVPDGVRIRTTSGQAPRVDAAMDTDPREFLISVDAWPAGEPLRLRVRYFACVGEEACHIVDQHYTLHRKRDEDGGGARGEGAGFWEADEFAGRLMADDRDGDGRLSRSEVSGIVLPHFDVMDANGDGTLDVSEVRTLTEWLNKHHQPGMPTRPSSPDSEQPD